MDHERPETTSDTLFVALKGARRGQPLSVPGLQQIIRDARGRAELSHGTCHELRHTCFTRLHEAGMAIEAIQAQAGHRFITSTRVYLHLGVAGSTTSITGPPKPSRPRRWWGWPDDRARRVRSLSFGVARAAGPETWAKMA